MTDEQEWRDKQRAAGCNCDCERVWDPARIDAVRPEGYEGECVVFHHTDECWLTRLARAKWN